MRYSISDHCRWVRGKSGSAIYDLRGGLVYAINPEGTNELAKAVQGEDCGESAFLDSLKELDLLNCHSFPIPDIKIKPSLRYVWLELTGACNCRCLHCYGAFGVPNKSELRQELTVDEWKSAIDKIIAMGGNAVQLIGGEPLLHPHFSEILQYVSDVGMDRIDIFTNGHFITDELADLIAQANASVRISLYGFDAASHDAITQHPGSFARLDKGIDLLSARNVPITMAVVLMQENQEYLEQIKQYIISKGLTYNGFDTVRSVKHCPQQSHAVTRQDIILQRYMCKPRFTTSPESFSRNHRWNSCWYGKFAITSKGDIIPCIFARDIVCGNIRTDSWERIRENLLDQWGVTKDSVETCKDCEFRYACDDCRPLSLGDGDGILGKYPRCLYNPTTCEWETLVPKAECPVAICTGGQKNEQL